MNRFENYSNLTFSETDTRTINDYFTLVDEDDTIEYQGNYSVFKDYEQWKELQNNDTVHFCCGIDAKELELEQGKVFVVYDYGH